MVDKFEARSALSVLADSSAEDRYHFVLPLINAIEAQLGFRLVKMSDIVKIHECLPPDPKVIPGFEFNYPQDLANVALRRIREAVMSMSSSPVPAQQPTSWEEEAKRAFWHGWMLASGEKCDGHAEFLSYIDKRKSELKGGENER